MVAMTHQPNIELTFDQALHAAIADVNRWRGHCLELHARLERAINAALRHWQPTCSMPQKFSDRLRALQSLTGAGGPYANEGLAELISQLQELRSEWRDRLAHATSTVHLDEERRWVWHYSMPRSGRDNEDRGAINCQMGEELERKLGRAVNVLRSRLRQLDVPSCC